MIDNDQLEEKPLSKWQQHRFMAMIAVAIMIALFLVSVALALYASSGAAQLDLSRPGYVSVRDKADKNDDFDGFPATGTITNETMNQFRKLYEAQSQKATGLDSFGGNALSDQALSLDSPIE